MNKTIKTFTAAFGLVIALFSLQVSATPVLEIGDAGFVTGTAQIVASGTNQILGFAGGSGANADVDVFGFGWAGGALTIDTIGSSFDTILYLFDMNGIGIAGNDDYSGLQSQLSFANVAAGNYFVAISSCCNVPTSSTGYIFNPFCCGGQISANGSGALSALTGWDYGTPPAGSSSYNINFSSASMAFESVPEPGMLSLFVIGLAGMLRRRRSA